MKLQKLLPIAGAATLALLSYGSAAASADVVPGVWITEDGNSVFVEATVVKGEKLMYGIDGYSDDTAVARLDALFNPDPSIGAAMALIDLGTPSTFGFTFSTPIVTTVGPQYLKLTLGGSCTDGSPTGGGCSASLAPAGLGFLAAASLNGVPLTFGGGAFGTATSGGSASFATTIFTTIQPGGSTVLDLHLDFMGSGGEDAYAFTLRADVTPVPEPSTYALLAAGLGVLGFVARRRRT